MIPFDLKIYSLIYECGRWLTLLLSVAWFVCAFRLMLRRNRWFWLWLAVWPCAVLPLGVGITWCGFHYRMELRDRFARTDHGWTDPYSRGPVDIDKMPPEIRAEYAKHNCHPRQRDLKAQTAGCIVMLPTVYFFGALGWLLRAEIGKSRPKRADSA